MSDSGVVFPYELSSIIGERVKAWEKLDEAQGQLTEMEKLSSQITVSNAAEIPVELTSDKTPPAEVAAAYQNFQMELARITKAQVGIKAYQAEIKKIETDQTIMAILVGIVTLLVLGTVAVGGLLILTSVLSSLSQ